MLLTTSWSFDWHRKYTFNLDYLPCNSSLSNATNVPNWMDTPSYAHLKHGPSQRLQQPKYGSNGPRRNVSSRYVIKPPSLY